ncbi:MAG: TonB family protein, partial [Thermodesulfobacteriota bacterium]
LWALAGLLAIVALIVFIPTLLPNARLGAKSPTVLPTRAAQAALLTRSPVPTVTPSPSPTQSSTPLPTLAPMIVPTPPAEGVLLNLAPNPDRTGWLGSKELAPHLRDRNLHSGAYQGQSLVGVAQFDLNGLPPGSKILYAALELTGRNARFLGQTGEWNVELIEAQPSATWDDATYDAIAQLPRLALLGKPYAAQELAAGLVNRFVFTPDQLKLLEKQLDIGALNLRVRGPSSGSDNLFTWDAGPGATAPSRFIGGMGVYDAEAVEVPPRVVRRELPQYPPSARRLRLEGTVMVSMVIDAQGKPRHCTIREAQPKGVFEESALAAANGFRFVPGKVGGKDVATRVIVPFHFKMSN